MSETPEKPLVCIIIPVRNRADEMRRLLESVKVQDYPAERLEVVVVDALSDDGTQDVCREYSFVKLLVLDEERHVSRNAGARETKADYLIHIDSDMELVPNTVSTLVEIATGEGYDFLSIPERSTGDTMWARARALEKYVIDDDLDRCGARFMDHKAFDKVGGYDEEILFSEDYNIHTRLLHAGFKHRVAKETYLHHHEGCTMMAAARKQFYYSQSAHKYFKKFKGVMIRQYNPLRMAYFKHIGRILRHPVLFAALMFGKFVTYVFGSCGMLYGWIKDSPREAKNDV